MQDEVRCLLSSITSPFHPGDRVFLFSDGFTDQFGGANDKKFGNRAFRELLLSSSTLPMLEQQKLLETTLEDWMKGTHQTDDICVLGFAV